MVVHTFFIINQIWITQLGHRVHSSTFIDNVHTPEIDIVTSYISWCLIYNAENLIFKRSNTSNVRYQLIIANNKAMDANQFI